MAADLLSAAAPVVTEGIVKKISEEKVLWRESSKQRANGKVDYCLAAYPNPQQKKQRKQPLEAQNLE